MKIFIAVVLVIILVIPFLFSPTLGQRFRQQRLKEARYNDSMKNFQKNFIPYDTTKKYSNGK